jgi:hypothetical protein
MPNHMWSISVVLIMAVIGCASTAAAQTPRPGPTRDAAEAYLAYVAVVEKATTLDEVKPHLSRDALAMLGGSPSPQEAAQVLEMLQAMMPSEIAIVDATPKDHGIELRVRGTSAGAVALGVVGMVREDGAWKIGRESWRFR